MNDHPAPDESPRDAAHAARVVVVTGAAGNLGRALAAVFAAQGDALVLVDRAPEALARAFGAGGGGRRLLALDLLDAAQVEAAFAALPRIDVLCNLAGGFSAGEPVHATPPATFDLLFDLNLRTLANACRAAVPRMLAQGRGWVVNVGAQAALKGAAGMGAYSASKAGVLRLTEAMAAELRARGVNVNCVLPSIIDTPENRAAMPAADATRWVAPHDLARVIAFLASEAARAVHGAALPVAGLS